MIKKTRRTTTGEAEFMIPKRTPQPGQKNAATQMMTELKTKHTKNARGLAVGKLGLPAKSKLLGKTEKATPKMMKFRDSTMAEIGEFEPRKRMRSAEGGHWMQEAFSKHPGALHRELGIAKGKKIPIKTLKKAKATGSPLLKKRANLALIGDKYRP